MPPFSAKRSFVLFSSRERERASDDVVRRKKLFETSVENTTFLLVMISGERRFTAGVMAECYRLTGSLTSCTSPKKKRTPADFRRAGFINSGDVLLSRNLEMHYHWGCSVSLPCSEWERVGPLRYDHQKAGEAETSPWGKTSGAVFSQLHQKIWSPTLIKPACSRTGTVPASARPALSLKEQGVL